MEGGSIEDSPVHTWLLFYDMSQICLVAVTMHGEKIASYIKKAITYVIACHMKY